MAATTRILRITCTTLEQGSSSSCSFSKNCNFAPMGSAKVSCISNRSGFAAENCPPCATTCTAPVEVNAAVSTSGCVITSHPKTEKPVDLSLLLSDVADFLVTFVRRLILVVKSPPWKLHLQMSIEKVIMDCRFFTMLAVGGSLLGSALCFVEGGVLIVESYLQYFHLLSQGSAQVHLVHLLIEAIDMFLVATDASSDATKTDTLHSRVGMQTTMQAKSKIGQAVIMVLQVGVLEKIKTIPLVTGFDLACFAGVVFTSSACIFLLSKLAVRR